MERLFDLAVTVSLRNTHRSDTVVLESADYFDTHGQLIRQYVKAPVLLLPMETIEIVIAELDEAGGTGGNFLFDWRIKAGGNPPHFEAVMISTYGQQGLSFTTTGIRIK